MDYPKHEMVFSKIRMLKYHRSVAYDDNRAINLYKNNILLCQSVYPLISVLEVSLRNAIDITLKNHFKSNNWIVEQKKGFMVHPDLTYRDRKLGKNMPDVTFVDKVFRVEHQLKFQKSPTHHNRIVAELSFGFWTKFFDSAPISVLKGAQLSAFKNKPRIPAKEIHNILNDIRVLRNRIAHHEPICFDVTGKFCLKSFNKKYLQIKEVIRWIDSDLRAWTDSIDNVHYHLKAIIP